LCFICLWCRLLLFFINGSNRGGGGKRRSKRKLSDGTATATITPTATSTANTAACGVRWQFKNEFACGAPGKLAISLTGVLFGGDTIKAMVAPC
jgi:hypothetical protein